MAGRSGRLFRCPMLLRYNPDLMPTGRYTIASALRRSYLGAGAAAMGALVLSLGAVLGLFDAEVAVEGSIVLALIVAAFYALLRSGFSQRFDDPALSAAQLAVAFIYLAYLTYRTEDAPAALALLYAVTMLYGMLRLDPGRLALLAVLAVVSHGVMLFMLIDAGHLKDLAAAWTQFGALALALAAFVAAAGTVKRLRERLSEANRRLVEVAEEANDRASRDALTRVYHRRHLLEALEREASRATRWDKPLSIARVDIDRFRSLNAELGYDVGDAVLSRFAEVAQTALRDVDVFGRYGGKEFLLIMPDTDLAGAVIAGERLRAAVNGARFAVDAGRRVTCTSGVTQYVKGERVSSLLTRAEASLSYAKAAGRD